VSDLASSASALEIGSGDRYDAFMDVVADRITTRAFQPDCVVPREHFGLILDAARHGPSGANAQPLHFLVASEAETRHRISDYFVEEQARRARLGMKLPTPNYRGIATAPGLSGAEIEEWIKTKRHRVMYRGEENVD
jgi:5,6-dimethylbenzimidazole synthase